MSVYHPSARVRLTLRTEEFQNTEALEANLPPADRDEPQAPKRTTEVGGTTSPPSRREQLRANSRSLRELRRRRRDIPREKYLAQVEQLRIDRRRIRRGQPLGQEVPESVSGTPPDDLTVVGGIQPVSMQIERNGLTTADTCTVTLDYADAPFDPRVIRAAHIEVLLGVVPPEDYEAGVERGERRADGSLRSIIAVPEDGSSQGWTRFVGFVDEWSVKYSEDGDQVVLECRDMSAPLRDIKLASGESIDTSLPLVEAIQRLVDSIPTTRGVPVEFDGEGTAPSLDSLATTRRRRPRRGRRRRRVRRGGQEMTVWDHLTDVCAQLGFVVTVNGFAIRIIEPRTLYARQGVRRMVYGRNLDTLEFSRRLQGVKVPTIEVRSYDPELGRTRWGRYPTRPGEPSSGVFGEVNPPRPLRANEVTPSGANPTEKIKTITVSGVTDPARLTNIARQAFEQIGRQEIEGAFTSDDPSSFENDFALADLMQLTAGDAVELLVAQSDTEGTGEVNPNTTAAQLQSLSRERRSRYLQSLGWDRTVSDRFAALQEATGFETVFRTQDVRLNWDNEEGFKINVGFQNFITVREDPQ